MNTAAAAASTATLGANERRALRLLNTLGSSEWTRLARSTRQSLRLRGLADSKGLTDLGRQALA
jgi:hypothetical protein